MKASDHQNNFDVLRLIFACVVVLHHVNVLIGYEIRNPLFDLSGVGVYGFFVISGYMITWSLDRDERVLPYVLKRFFRIYPLLMFMIVIQAIAFTWLSTREVGLWEIARYVTLNGLFMTFLAPTVGDSTAHLAVNAINGSLWTLKIEVAFYAILPFLLLLTRRFGAAILVVTMIGGYIYFTTLSSMGRFELAKQLPGQMVFFCTGILLYRYRDNLMHFRKWGIAATLVSAFFLVVVRPYLPFRPYIDYVSNPLALAVFVFAAASFLPVLRLRHDISYGVYLIHFPLIQAALILGVPTAAPLPFFVGIGVCTLALAWLSAIALEEPATGFARKLIKRLAARHPQASDWTFSNMVGRPALQVRRKADGA